MAFIFSFEGRANDEDLRQVPYLEWPFTLIGHSKSWSLGSCIIMPSWKEESIVMLSEKACHVTRYGRQDMYVLGSVYMAKGKDGRTAAAVMKTAASCRLLSIYIYKIVFSF